jgi:hypothetical protein
VIRHTERREWRGYHLEPMRRSLRAASGGRDGGLKTKPWAARLESMDAAGRIVRVFLDGQIDFCDSNSKGSRGVYLYWHLEPDWFHEIWTPRSRDFLLVRSGEAVSYTIDEVREWLQRDRDLALTC